MNSNLILIPHLKVQNANALSSPFTIGFPAMTAWLGAVHALQRKLNAEDMQVKFSGTGVVCHDFSLQTHKGPGDYVHSIVGTGNPLEPKTEKDKPKENAVRPSFIEEARCHLETSIVIQYEGIEAHQEEEIRKRISHYLNAGLKLAGGDILSFYPPEFIRKFDLLKHKLMPGYVIIERRDLMQQAMERGQDAIDALLDYLAIHHTCSRESKNGEEHIVWQSKRKETGWIVPISTGFQGVSKLGQALNQRDPSIPHRFAESVVTLGEFVMSYRMESLQELLWFYQGEDEKDLYLCQQQRDPQPINEEENY